MGSATDADFLPTGDAYDDLPEPIRFVVSRQEYLWLSDAEKARLEQDLTEPEVG